MNIHIFQNADFENEAYIAQWAAQRGHTITRTCWYEEDAQYPCCENFDWLIIMGGPMNIYDEDQYPWLIREKRFIRNAIFWNKKVIGICLGAQLISDVLEGKVTRNEYKEIGWYPVRLVGNALEHPFLIGFPEVFSAFLWHGDTFSIPPMMERIAESEGCPAQGFVLDNRVIALQFHLESTQESISAIIKNCAEELVDGRFIQKDPIVLQDGTRVQESNRLMVRLLDNIANYIDNEEEAAKKICF